MGNYRFTAVLALGAFCSTIFCRSAIEAFSGESHFLQSPNGNVELNIQLVDVHGRSNLQYKLNYHGHVVLDASMLTFSTATGVKIGDSLRLQDKPQMVSHDSTWRPVYGEQSTVRDCYNELRLHLSDQDSGYSVKVRFRCYDAGAAFQSTIEGGGDSVVCLSEERSEFRFPSDFNAWCTPRAQGEYKKLPLSGIEGAVERPLTISLAEGRYAALAEAGLVDYATMKLRRAEDDPLCLFTSLGSKVQATKEITTPWRVIMLGESPGELLENNALLMNLSEPCAIQDTSWIQPGKVLREITLTTDGAMACIEFAKQHNFRYVEFDAGWYGHEYSDDSDASTVTVDPERSKGPLDLPFIIDYAAQRGIGIILYVNRRALETQLDRILPLYQGWGVKGVKYGFVNTGSQEWTAWLHRAIRQAASHRLMVDVHDEYRPVGYSRTYPNLMTQEGVRGDEAAPSSRQSLTTLFTRNLAGAADHTICYFDPRVSVHWTHGHQLAKAVCTFSPWQFMFWYDTPLTPAPPGKHNNLMIETPEIEFFAKVPTVWDESKVIHGVIGEYAVIARRDGMDWYIGAMNNDEPRNLRIPLDFLDNQRNFVARRYFDDPMLSSKTKVRIEDMSVDSSTVLECGLLANGGQAIWITPVSSR